MTPIASHGLINCAVLISAPQLFIPGGEASCALWRVFMLSYCLAPYWCWEQLYSGAVVGLLNRDQLNLGHVPAWIRTSPWGESYRRSCQGEDERCQVIAAVDRREGWLWGDGEEDGLPSALLSISTDGVFTRSCVCVCGGMCTNLFCMSRWSWGVVLVKVIREDVWR